MNPQASGSRIDPNVQFLAQPFHTPPQPFSYPLISYGMTGMEHRMPLSRLAHAGQLYVLLGEIASLRRILERERGHRQCELEGVKELDLELGNAQHRSIPSAVWCSIVGFLVLRTKEAKQACGSNTHGMQSANPGRLFHQHIPGNANAHLLPT